jgi:uncharacterized membrane protein
MFDRGLSAVTFAAAIGSGLVAGIFYAFSSFVMPALARIAPASGFEAMNSINVTVITPSFMLVFIGTALLCLILIAGSFFWWGGTGGKLVLISSLIYLVGSIGVTMFLNVPLNDALAAVQPGSAEAGPLWTRFLDEWIIWNHVRTLASLASMILFILALLQ